ncbi:MAG: GNAT family N-acetyltransferase [Anaerolineales bacterium]
MDDLQPWKTLVASDKESTVFHDVDFIKIMENVYHCLAIPQIINIDGQTCGISAFHVSSFLSGRKLTSMPFNAYPSLIGQQDEERAFSHLISVAGGMGRGVYVEYKTFYEVGLQPRNGKPVFRTSTSIVSTLSLQADYTSQQRVYSKSRRTDIRRTRKHAFDAGIQFIRASELGMVWEFYNLLSRLYRDKHRMIPQPWELYKQIYSVLVPRGLADYYLALKDGAVVAGIVLLKKNTHWEYCWAASSPELHTLGLNALLVDVAIQDAISAGIKTFGFGSSSPVDNHLIFFKESWGCEHKPVYYYYWNHEPKPIDLETSFSTVRSLFRFTPLWLVRLASSYLVPQLV